MSLLPSLWGSSTERDPFRSLHQEVNRLFDQFGRGLPAAWAPGNGMIVAPTVDISESDGEFTVTAELPGVAEADMQLSLDDNILTIKGEKKQEETKEDKEKRYRLVERSYGSFQRSIPLPFAADPDKVQASFKDGVLKVTIPKPPEAEAKSTRIPIGKG